VRTKSDPQWRKSNLTASIGHITRHCNAIREAVDALIEIMAMLHTASRDSVDYTNIGSWVGTIGQHVPSLARTARLFAVLTPFEDRRETIRQTGLALCEAIKKMLKGLWHTLQPSRGTQAAKFAHLVEDTQNKTNMFMHLMCVTLLALDAPLRVCAGLPASFLLVRHSSIHNWILFLWVGLVDMPTETLEARKRQQRVRSKAFHIQMKVRERTCTTTQRRCSNAADSRVAPRLMSRRSSAMWKRRWTIWASPDPTRHQSSARGDGAYSS
jgi:hypothetical protein